MAKKPVKRNHKKAANLIAFVEHYLSNGRNAKRAYMAAHPQASERAAEIEGSAAFNNPEVKAYLEQRETEIRERLRLTTDNVLLALSRVVHFDYRRLYNENGVLKAPHEIDDDTAAALVGIEIESLTRDGLDVGTIKRVKISDRVAAINSAMKHLGLFEKDREQLGNAIGRAIVVPAKAKRG